VSKYLIYFTLICISIFAYAGENDIDSFVLNGEEAKKVFDQCSRPVPTNISGYWKPGKNDIQILEASLQKYNKPKDIRYPMSDFYAQYVGFIRNKKKYIYINFFHNSIGKTIANAIEFAKKENRKELEKKYKNRMGYWEREAVNVCDGGDQYWGLVFDPELKVFTDLQVNGEA
jgi:hypothetical protein